MEYIHERCRSSVEKPPWYQLTVARSVPRFVFICYKLIGTFLFGAAVNQSVTDISKYTIGRLRPHFLDVCRPNITAGICDSHVPGVYVYVDNFTCTTPEDKKQLDSRYVMTCLNHILRQTAELYMDLYSEFPFEIVEVLCSPAWTVLLPILSQLLWHKRRITRNSFTFFSHYSWFIN